MRRERCDGLLSVTRHPSTASKCSWATCKTEIRQQENHFFSVSTDEAGDEKLADFLRKKRGLACR